MNSKTWKSASNLQFLTLLSIFFIVNVSANEPDWSAGAKLPGNEICEWHHGHKVCFGDENRANIYDETPSQMLLDQEAGAKHALVYPVEATELLIPEESIQKYFSEDSNSPIRRLIYRAAKLISNFKSMDEVYNWLGLHKYPKSAQGDISPNPIPRMDQELKIKRMGVSPRDFNGAKVATISCAACHASDLFGVKILGMSNRFPRANRFFHTGKRLVTNTPNLAFKIAFDPSEADYHVFKKAKSAMNYIEVVEPLALGLDTSLAQVGLSLSRRGDDEYAQRIPFRARFPRSSELRSVPADSKPAVWWNLKYKTRWLSDGSIVSGNPIHTNFLWNEIGRGVDLEELENWLVDNKDKIKELTSFVFSTKAPRYNNFFPNRISISKARRGEKLFLKSCSGCHGKYEKGWSDLNSINQENYESALATTKVWYHKKTPVIDVDTDPYRHQGMNYFYKGLNKLKISKTIGTVVKPQKGYVPPPLVGIWARWPYFHNNSVPTLYDVLTPDTKRPKTYISVPAQVKSMDFDQEKNGYPAPEKVRLPYRNNKEHFFNTRVKGLSNLGHTKMMVNEDGSEKFSHQEKLEIIEFLKTL